MVRREFDIILDVYSTQAKSFIAGTTTKQTPWFITSDKIDSALLIQILSNEEIVDCTGYNINADFYNEENTLLAHVIGTTFGTETNTFEIILDDTITISPQDIMCSISLHRDVDEDGTFYEDNDAKLSFQKFRIKIK